MCIKINGSDYDIFWYFIRQSNKNIYFTVIYYFISSPWYACKSSITQLIAAMLKYMQNMCKI